MRKASAYWRSHELQPEPGTARGQRTYGGVRRSRGSTPRGRPRRGGQGPLRDACEDVRGGPYGAVRARRVRRGRVRLRLLLSIARRGEPRRRGAWRDARGTHQRRHPAHRNVRNGGAEDSLGIAAGAGGEDRLFLSYRAGDGLRRLGYRDESREG